MRWPAAPVAGSRITARVTLSPFGSSRSSGRSNGEHSKPSRPASSIFFQSANAGSSHGLQSRTPTVGAEVVVVVVVVVGPAWRDPPVPANAAFVATTDIDTTAATVSARLLRRPHRLTDSRCDIVSP